MRQIKEGMMNVIALLSFPDAARQVDGDNAGSELLASIKSSLSPDSDLRSFPGAMAHFEAVHA